MVSQPQNPEFRINPENFHPCKCRYYTIEEVNNNDANLAVQMHRLVCILLFECNKTGFLIM